MSHYDLEAFDADGRCLRIKTPISEGNLQELAAELRMDLSGTVDPKHIEDAIAASGHSADPFDWLTQAYGLISRFALNARDLGANEIRFTPAAS
ncbi:MAG: hypothetical protein CL949_13725 [Erythrobacter sp.]|nr:hypothetical protein [Erythrobacter sp.]